MSAHDDRLRTRRQRPGTETTEENEETRTDRLTCPECGAEGVTDEGRGETVCTECGVVIEDGIVDRGPEWRSFDGEDREQKSRVGAPTTGMLHDRGLSSVIDWRDRDASGRTIDSDKRRELQRLRTWDERFRTKDAQERNLKQALGEIDRMASALGLPENVRETASVIYRRAVEEELLPGRSIEAMATGSLYAAARQAGTPRSLDEFDPVSRVDRREFARAYRYLAKELGLAVEPADPVSYLPRFASELEVPDEAENTARRLLETAKSQGVHSGKSPVGLAAAAIYAGCILVNDRITQREIGDVANVSEVTIRNRYKELLEAQDDAAVPA